LWWGRLGISPSEKELGGGMKAKMSLVIRVRDSERGEVSM
jgi:hypothetical protein